jgi:hypothetical protein
VKIEFHSSIHAYTLKWKNETIHEGKKESIHCYIVVVLYPRA